MQQTVWVCLLLAAGWGAVCSLPHTVQYANSEPALSLLSLWLLVAVAAAALLLNFLTLPLLRRVVILCKPFSGSPLTYESLTLTYWLASKKFHRHSNACNSGPLQSSCKKETAFYINSFYQKFLETETQSL